MYYVTKTNENIIKFNKYVKQLLIHIFNKKNGRSCSQLTALSWGYGLWSLSSSSSQGVCWLGEPESEFVINIIHF